MQTTTGTGEYRFPLLQGLLPIRPSQVPTEILAGITLAALAIPEVLGYTKIAGTPVITGLYTILLPMALFACIGSSRHLVVGADSASAAILAAGLSGLAATGSAEYVALSSLVALLAAGFIFLSRVIGLGFLADFLSRTVLVGFLTGVGIQVSLGQLSGMLGLPSRGHGPIQQVLGDLQQINAIHFYTPAVAAGVLAVIVGSKRISDRIPGPLIAVIGVIIVSRAFDLHSLGVAVMGTVPSGLPHIGLPKVDWSWGLIGRLIPMAFSIFIVVLAQSAATSRAYAARYNEQFNENLDLVGLGLANLGAGLCGTFPVNGSPTKTQMVDSAGGRTQLAQVVTTGIVLLVVLFLTEPLAYMPEAALSAVVFLIGLSLIDIRGMQRIYREARSEFWVALITAAVVLFVGVEQGILLAMVLSLLDHVRHGYHPKNMLILPSQSHGWRTAPLNSSIQFEPGLLVYRFSHSLYYANAELFLKEVNDLVQDPEPPLKWFCIVADAIDEVDFSAAEALRSVVASLQEKGIRLVFAMVSAEVKAEFDRYGITRLVGEDAFYATDDDILGAYLHKQS